MEKVFDFIEDITYQHFAWLKEKESSFPYCCYISSEVLGSYIQANFNVGKVCLGKKKKTNRYYNFHEWIEIGGYIVDFTRFQYSARNRRRKYKNYTTEDTFDICINIIQEGKVVFSLDEYYEDFTKKLEILPRFIDIAKDKEYGDYLDEVLKDKRFEVFNFYDNIPTEDRYWENNFIETTS